MSKEKTSSSIEEILVKGFRNDKQHLISNMCRQFPDKRFFIKEYVVNASDAGATKVTVTGTVRDGYIIVTISDNGKGMNRSEVIAFFTVFHSSKTGDMGMAGRFGIGKLAVAAIENQVGFEMETSNGTESWRARTGALIRNEKITIEKVKPGMLQKGTTFRITYKLTLDFGAEMAALKKVLDESVCFLPLNMIIHMPDKSGGDAVLPVFINQDWPGSSVTCHQTFIENIKGYVYRITLGLGRTFQGIYQNNIFITDKYNLLFPNTSNMISGLTIMVDSPGFDLPFGRHTIKNEEILEILSQYIINHLNGFYYSVLSLYKRRKLQVSRYEFDVFTSDLIYHYHDDYLPWLDIPIFAGVNETAYSFNDLRMAIRKGQYIFTANPNTQGIDFTVYNGIVLCNDQAGKCATIVKTHFSDRLIDLNIENLIMEERVAGNSGDQLSVTEKKFEKHLGFQPDMFPGKWKDRKFKNDMPLSSLKVAEFTSKTSVKEIESANSQLENIRWRVSRLVERDGVSKCETHLYLFDKNRNTIILNLYHPRIKKLVALTEINANLAAHFAMSLALLDKQNILPHIQAGTRETLLLLDALSRISDANPAVDLGGSLEKYFRNYFSRYYDNLN